MKALTLWQPWATLIAIGAKTYETRSWRVDYEGPLLIHAAKSTDGLHMAHQHPFIETLAAAGYKTIGDLPKGAFVCRVWLHGCYRTETVRGSISEREFRFGNYSDGRWAWKLTLEEMFDPPAPARGMQGLWEWEGGGLDLSQ